MKIAMMTEGTYPHGFGGVSVWCDQLIRGMPGYDFSLVAIVATGAERMVWSLPDNVEAVDKVPLWSAASAGPAMSRRNGVPADLLRELIDSLLDSSTVAQPRFAGVLRELFEFAQRRNLSAALGSDKAVQLLSEAWRKRPPVSRRAAPTLHDAISAMQLLDHSLRPSSYPPPQADLAHAVTNGLAVLPALAAKWRYGTPMIVTEHGVYLREQYLQNRKSPYRWPVKAFHLSFMRRLCALGYSEAAAITPGNVYNRRWEERLGAEPARIRTVYNGVDPADFPALSGEPDAPTISWVGRIDPIKDVETLIRAFALVHEEMPAARLRLFGSPPKGREPYLERCQALAADLGIAGSVTFEGRVENIRDAYDAGQIVALSSVSEGFPYSLIEAMTCGRTCVATDVGGVTEAVGDTGLVVPPRSPKRMAQACLTLLQNDDLRHRLGAAARTRALENFTVDGAISAFDEIYSFVGAARPGPTAPIKLTTEDPSGDLTALGGRRMIARTLAAPRRAQVPPVANGARRLTVVPAEDAKPRDLVELCEQFIGVCESAVDPLEISSALEFDGLNDQAVRAMYGFSDVFALAEEMYQRVPRRPAEPEPVADPWQISKIRSAMHGLIYSLPAICFPAAAGLLTGPGVLRVLVVALLSSWALSQGLAYLGYVRLGRSDANPAARVLLAGMTAGTGATGLVMTLTALTEHVHMSVLAFGFGLGTYMLGATVLMVLGAERLLLVVLAPAVLGSATFLALGRPHYLEYASWGALAATPALALGLATWRAGRESGFFGQRRGRSAKTREAAGPLITAADLRGALPSVGFGLVVAGLLVVPIAAALPGRPNTGALLASLPLALSMGVAEWTLVWFRRRTQRLLRATREVPAFAYRARLTLLTALLHYLTAAALLTAAAVVVATAAHLIHPHWAIAPQIAAYLALGGAMFVALLLQAFGSRIFPLITCAAALAFEVLWRRMGVPGQLAACTELLVVLTGYAALVLGKAVRHAR